MKNMVVMTAEKAVSLTEQINESRRLFEQAVAERNQLRQDLAAARALLREASGWLGDNDAEESLIRRIDAALAGERREGEG